MDSPYQWGYVDAIHVAGTTTLYANASLGATSIQTNGYVAPNAIMMIGTLVTGIRAVSVTGTTAPYTVALAQPLPTAQSSGATVTLLATLDLYLDGTQGLADTAYLVTGIKYLASYSPTVGDVVLVCRGTGHLKSDRVALGKLA